MLSKWHFQDLGSLSLCMLSKTWKSKYILDRLRPEGQNLPFLGTGMRLCISVCGKIPLQVEWSRWHNPAKTLERMPVSQIPPALIPAILPRRQKKRMNAWPSRFTPQEEDADYKSTSARPPVESGHGLPILPEECSSVLHPHACNLRLVDSFPSSFGSCLYPFRIFPNVDHEILTFAHSNALIAFPVDIFFGGGVDVH